MKGTSLDIAKSLYASVRRQDSDAVLALFAEDALIYGPTYSTEILPWGGMYSGKDKVRQFFGLLREGLDIEQLDIMDIIAEREKVAVLGRIRGKSRTKGKLFDTQFAHIIRTDLNHEKITEFRVFNDSAALAESLR